MISTMTTNHPFNILTILLITIGSYEFARVGDKCTIKTTGVTGTCKFSSDCPGVEEQARNGISPTLCSLYQFTVPIVCCENNVFSLQPNENSFLNQESNSDSFVYPDGNNEPAIDRPHSSISEERCQEYSKAVTGTVQAIPLVTNTEAVTINTVKCDYNGVALIVGGKPATAGEFPFMAAIGFNVDNKIEWKCGGTLISDEYVLTAAHCTFSRDDSAPTKVRLGDLDLKRTDDGSVHVDYDIKKIIVHPNYRYPLKYNDIALFQLSKKVKFTRFIRPACLHAKSSIQQQQAIATGWGKTDYLAPEISSKLMKVSLSIYDNQKCSEIYKPSKNIPEGVKSSMLCAGELKGGMDTCQGDSGGPLLVTKKGNQCTFYIIGVTSFGKYCGQENIPAIYTRVAQYVPWIEKTIW